MKKRYLILMLAGTLLIGTVFGAFVVRYVWQVNMGMRLAVSYDVSLEWLNGTDITAYDWGDFSPGETKTLDAYFAYHGNVEAYFTWNTTDLPSGWDVAISIGYEPPEEWVSGSTIWSSGPFAAAVHINLTETGATLNQAETFTLNFLSGEGP